MPKRTLKKTDFRVFYPEYFDKQLSRRMGRRVPKKLAFKEPSNTRVALAAKKCGYEVYLDSDKHYPRTWYKSNGRVLVRKEDSKEEQLRKIAKMLPKVNVPEEHKKPTKSKDKKPRKGVYRQKP